MCRGGTPVEKHCRRELTFASSFVNVLFFLVVMQNILNISQKRWKMIFRSKWTDPTTRCCEPQPNNLETRRSMKSCSVNCPHTFFFFNILIIIFLICTIVNFFFNSDFHFNYFFSVAKETLEGHQRAIMGMMSVEQIYRDRKTFSNRYNIVKASYCVQLLNFLLPSDVEGPSA